MVKHYYLIGRNCFCCFLLLVIWGFSAPAFADSFNFTASCLNVDGLPNKILGITVNDDGPGSEGSKKLSQKIASQDWDFMGFSEDFNYHNELISALSANYHVGTHRAEINLSALTSVADTDGLGFLCKKSYTMSGERWVRWNECVGDLTHGADEKIKKGYRYYCVDFGNGYQVDVYILHMNCESTQKAVNVKHSQIAQLVAEIKANKNGRPIIVMGDTNCRYTREELKKRFIDAINADPRYYVQDAWVELIRGGIYPTCYYPNLDVGSIMVDQYGQQKGEVVDKLFYINNRDSGVKLTANSYLHDDSFKDENGTRLSDHYPVVVNFTIDKHDYDPNTPLGPEPETPGELDGTYYLRNVATGLYLAQGLNWGTQGVVDYVGLPVTLRALGNGYQIRTPYGFLTTPYVYIDNTDPENELRPWLFTRVGDAYVIENEKLVLTVENQQTGEIRCKQTADPTQHLWQLVTPEQRKADLLKASPIAPADASFLMKNPRFYVLSAETRTSWTVTNARNAKLDIEAWDGFEGTERDFMLRLYNAKVTTGSTTTWTATQTIEGLPAGRYSLSFDLLTSALGSITPTVNKKTQSWPADFPQIADNTSYLSAIRMLHNDDSHKYRCTFNDITVASDGKLQITFQKGSNSSPTATHFDNFQLIYLGPVDANGDFAVREINLIDAIPYDNPLSILTDKVTYTRHFGHANWQALYVPFDMPFDAFKQYVAQNEANDKYCLLEFSGVTGGTAEFTYLQENEQSSDIQANTPYLFKPAHVGDITIQAQNTTVQPAAVESVPASGWAFVGNYQPVQGLYDENSYVLSGGEFRQVANNSVTLNPYRARLVPATAQRSQALKISVPDDNETGIEATPAFSAPATRTYDLQGRPVSHPKRGLYIRLQGKNGTKLLIK